MNAQELAFLKILEDVLERVVIPGSGNDNARGMATIAARQLGRLLVEETVVPALRQEAAIAYAALLPSLKNQISAELYSQLHDAVQENEGKDGSRIEAALKQILPVLMSHGADTSTALAGRLIGIDAQLRNGKEKAWSRRNTAKRSETEIASPGGLSDNEQVRLLEFLRQRFPSETALRIVSITPIPGGFSKQTLFVHLEGNETLPAVLVLRIDAAYETVGSSVTMEYPVIEKMYANGVAVPQPYALDRGDVLGRPFILLSRVDGRTIGDFVVVGQPSREVALDLAVKLARLHSVRIDGLEDIVLGGRLSVQSRVNNEIEKCHAVWQTVVHHRSHVVQAAIDWLRANAALADGPPCIIHGDVGVHNFLVKDGEVTAFLDWETSVVGTSLEDIGYTYYPVTQMIDWREYLAAYEEAAGCTLDRHKLDFYILWGSVRLAVYMNKLVDPVFMGERKSLTEFYLGDYFGQVVIQRVAEKMTELLA